ncbi:hypothetical protein B0I73DRAFT_89498 [Yarrowia lipolytica]|nr:hypothetical protein B0I73DRAFT_89498 [Yarrowia lipolytica]
MTTPGHVPDPGQEKEEFDFELDHNPQDHAVQETQPADSHVPQDHHDQDHHHQPQQYYGEDDSYEMEKGESASPEEGDNKLPQQPRSLARRISEDFFSIRPRRHRTVDDPTPRREMLNNTKRSFPNRAPGPPQHHFFWRFFHPWWFTDHLNLDGFIVILRDWIVSFTIIILMVVHKSARWLGPSCYLGLVMSIVMPSGQLSIISAFVINVLLMFFIMTGWVCANIVPMRISNTYFYDRWTVTDFMQDVVNRGLCSADLSKTELMTCLNEHASRGIYMKGSTSAIYAFWLGVTGCIHFYFKFKHPVYIPGAITGMIAACVSLVSSVHTPWFDAKEVGTGMMKPMGLALALNMFVAIVICPVTSSHQYMDMIKKEYMLLSSLIKFQRKFVAETRPSNETEWLKFNTIEGLILKIRGLFPVLSAMESSMPMEVTITRYSLAHYPSAKITVSRLASMMSGFSMFYDSMENLRHAVLEYHKGDTQTLERQLSFAIGTDNTKPDKKSKKPKDYAPVGAFETQHSMAGILRDEWKRASVQEQDGGSKAVSSDPPFSMADLDHVMETLDRISGPVLDSVAELLDTMVSWTNACNHFRTYAYFLPWMRKKRVALQKEQAAQLVEVYERYKVVRDQFIADRYTIFTGAEAGVLISRVLQGSLYCGYLQEILHNLDFMVDQMIDMDYKQPEPHFVTGLGNYVQMSKFRMSVFTGAGDAKYSNETEAEQSTFSLKSTMAETRDPDALPGQHIGHSVGGFIRSTYHHLIQTKFMVPLKGSIFVIIASFLALFKHSHHWYYTNRLYWVIVMTFLSVAELAVDNLYNIINRILHTFYAVIISMVAWYISTGKGHGNSYGYAVTMGIVYIPLQFYREFHPIGSPIPTIVLVITHTLVVGISWVDGQKISTYSIGVGWTVAWHRFVAVCCGIVIGSICSYLPHPYTGKKAVRKMLSSVIHETGNLFCEVSHFAAEKMRNPRIVVDAKADPIAAHINGIIMKLMGARRTTMILKYEPEMQGPWPAAVYKELIALLGEVVELYLHLYTILKRFKDPTFWLPHVLKCIGWRNQNLMSHYFAILYMSGSALERGVGLPEITPAHLLMEHVQMLDGQLYSLATESEVGVEDPGSPGNPQASPDIIEGAVNEHVDVSNERLRTSDGLQYISALSIANKIYDRMDRILIQVKMIVGEQYGSHNYYLYDHLNTV